MRTVEKKWEMLPSVGPSGIWCLEPGLAWKKVGQSALNPSFCLLSRIQNTVSVAIWENCSNVKIAFHIAVKTRFSQLKNLYNAVVSLRMSHILNTTYCSMSHVTNLYTTSCSSHWTFCKIVCLLCSAHGTIGFSLQQHHHHLPVWFRLRGVWGYLKPYPCEYHYSQRGQFQILGSRFILANWPFLASA